jgi:hypothetical protein
MRGFEKYHVVLPKMYQTIKMEIRKACTDKKENRIFLIFKELQKGSVAKSYMTNGLLIYG